MNKNILIIIAIHLFILSAPTTSYGTETQSEPSTYSLTTREQQLIQHIEQSIINAEQGISHLTGRILSIDGMSSPKVRHFLNNLCGLPNTNYLEVGSWKGSTWVAALYGNASTLSQATAIDNWSEFQGPKDDFAKNCITFLKKIRYRFIECDCFQTDLNRFSRPVNLYFYDGNHTELSQKLAFTYFNPIFDDTFIAVVDDWNFDSVPKGTYAAFEELGYTIVYERILPANFCGDTENWWNGIYVAVLRKTP